MAAPPFSARWNFEEWDDDYVQQWWPVLSSLRPENLLNFMLYANSFQGERTSAEAEPSMLGASVRYFTTNPRPLETALLLIPLLDAHSRQEIMAATDGNGSTALMDACVATPPSIALVRALLAAGANVVVNATDVGGRTALMLAASRDFADAVRELIEGASDVEQRDSSGRTVLQHACEAHASRATAALLASDATLDARTLWCCAPLIIGSFVQLHAGLALVIGIWMLANSTRARAEGAQRKRFLQWLRDSCLQWLRDLWRRFDGADRLAGVSTPVTEAGRPEARGHRCGRHMTRRRAVGAALTLVQSARAVARQLRLRAMRAVPCCGLSAERMGMSAESLLVGLLASIAMVSASTWSYERSTVPIYIAATGSETLLVWMQMLLYFATTAISASFFPDVRDEAIEQAEQIQASAYRSLFVHWSRLCAVGYIALHYFLYQYCRLVPVQTFDALSALLTGRTTLNLSSWIRCCASVHISMWMLLPWPFVFGGLQLTERLRSCCPPWKAFRCATSMIGLNDLLLCACCTAYLDVTSAAGHNPLPADIAQQLYLLHARAFAHSVTQLACAFMFTPANRLWLARRRGALMEVTRSAVARASAEDVQKGESSTEKPQPAAQLECVVCMDGGASCILAPCGHMCVCGSCGEYLARTKALCPLCRQPVQTTVTRVYCM